MTSTENIDHGPHTTECLGCARTLTGEGTITTRPNGQTISNVRWGGGSVDGNNWNADTEQYERRVICPTCATSPNRPEFARAPRRPRRPRTTPDMRLGNNRDMAFVLGVNRLGMTR